ncbi:MAG: sugar O-acetyltransferase [Lachnospiraceae bacterium]|nr:sugar O-acetyltransferase [Lachnospiraceae bacterium]
MSENERKFAGKLYHPMKTNIHWDECREKVKRFNESDFWRDTSALEELKMIFASVGEGFVLTPPFYCDHGRQISFGNHFYANTDLTILDENYVTIGDNVYLAPHVSIYTAGHPIDAGIRNFDLEYAKPVTIGNDVWVGGNVVINPGVTIGNNVVIGSGSVVTKNIPDNVVAAGNPCRVIREITEDDKRFWEEQYQEYSQDRDCQ